MEVWNLHAVRTPHDILSNERQMTLQEVNDLLDEELKLTSKWTPKCTEIIQKSATTLFLYDRMEFFISRAYGAHFKIILNPLMVLCCHPSCLARKKMPFRLKKILDISSYLKHLKDHSDMVGTAMQLRFNAIAEDHFMTIEQLDAISASPHSIANITDLSNKHANTFGIDRKFRENYTCHWKDRLIQTKVIKSNSLCFQEDDAMVYSILRYPNPVRNWNIWSTIELYAMKLYTSVSASALCLHRGLTNLRSTSQLEREDNIWSFSASINHPAPSVSTMQRRFPFLSYENDQFHNSETQFHLKILTKNDESIAIKYSSVIRYPVTLGIDDQEINQGVFIHNGHIHGLGKKVSAMEIKQIGYENFSKYIAEENNFVSSVREYRLTDFKGKFCSNVFTSFENALSFNWEKCNTSLLNVVQHAQKCLQCLVNGCDCHFQTIDVRCGNCETHGYQCISMLVWHVLWDMAPAHKKAFRLNSNRIDVSSEVQDYMEPVRFTIGFGGLHLAKSPINCSRNHVLTYNGQNFGINILRSYKQESDLSNLKNAVFIGKDRQSDLLAFLTTCDHVQEFLIKQRFYSIVRVPEPILGYTENAKSQKKIVFPTSIAANCNGDDFVLDTAAACLYVYDRSIVSKCYLVGRRDETVYKPDPKKNLLGKDVKLSTQLTCMCVVNNDMYVGDKGRAEIVILTKVVSAKAVLSARLHILSIENCVGICLAEGALVMLQQCDSGHTNVVFLSFTLPAKKSKSYTLHLSHRTTKIISPTCVMKGLFTVFDDGFFGAWSSSNAVYFFKRQDNEWSELNTHYISTILPSVSANCSTVALCEKDVVNLHTLQFTKPDFVGPINRSWQVANGHHICLWEKVIFLLRLECVNQIQLVEHGPLDFALKFCKAMNNFYRAVCYIPPNKQRSENMTLEDSISSALDVQLLFNGMQELSEEKYPNRTSFTGAEGSVPTATINCFNETINGWNALMKRANHFQKDLGKSIYPHSIVSESKVEHAFGFTKQSGQGHLLTLEEYVQAKRSNQIDFQLRMCDLPFSQKIKSKVRDKGYQDIQEHGRLDLSLSQIKEIFSSSDKMVPAAAETSVTEEEKVLSVKESILTC